VLGYPQAKVIRAPYDGLCPTMGAMPRRCGIDMSKVRAAAPLGVARESELIRVGLPGSTISSRCRPDGPWRRLLPGVILMQTGVPTDPQRLAAALAYAGGDALLTGAAACRMYGLRRLPADRRIHVLVPAERQPATTGFVVVERTIRMPAPLSVEGWPMAPLVRAVLDAARRIRRFDDVRALIAEAIQRGLCSVDELAVELAAGSRAGSARPRRVLREVGVGVHSVAEIDAQKLAVRSTVLPEFRWNVPVRDQHGAFIAVPDGWADDVALAWEIDSYEFHLSPEQYDRTLRRRAIMIAAGIVVAQTTPSRLRREPDQALRELESAYRQAQRRPRPPVRMAPTPAA
jgi:hypothetical protein